MANFVIRLNDETETALQYVMKLEDSKTKNGAIIKMINDYKFTFDSLDEERTRRITAESNLYALKKSLRLLAEAQASVNAYFSEL